MGAITHWLHRESNLGQKCIYHVTGVFPLSNEGPYGLLGSLVLLRFLAYF